MKNLNWDAKSKYPVLGETGKSELTNLKLRYYLIDMGNGIKEIGEYGDDFSELAFIGAKIVGVYEYYCTNWIDENVTRRAWQWANEQAGIEL